jgi:hypothetical protein
MARRLILIPIEVFGNRDARLVAMAILQKNLKLTPHQSSTVMDDIQSSYHRYTKSGPGSLKTLLSHSQLGGGLQYLLTQFDISLGFRCSLIVLINNPRSAISKLTVL